MRHLFLALVVAIALSLAIASAWMPGSPDATVVIAGENGPDTNG